MTNAHDKWDSYITEHKKRGRKKQDSGQAAKIRANKPESELRYPTEKAPAQGEKLTFWQRVFGCG